MTSRSVSEGDRPRLRADAARNRAQILTAARTAFCELGTAAPLDEIARRAGVNIATLYRRFPDRDALVQQIVLDGFALVVDSALTARDTAPSHPLAAVEGFLTRLVEERDLLVLPLLGGPVPTLPETIELQSRISPLLEETLAHARAAGAVRPDVTAMDLITTAALVCRPLPHLSPEQAVALVTRHVRLFMDGLSPHGAQPLPPAATHAELSAQLRAESTARR